VRSVGLKIHETLNRQSSRFETEIANGIERHAVVDEGKLSSVFQVIKSCVKMAQKKFNKRELIPNYPINAK